MREEPRRDGEIKRKWKIRRFSWERIIKKYIEHFVIGNLICRMSFLIEEISHRSRDFFFEKGPKVYRSRHILRSSLKFEPFLTTVVRTKQRRLEPYVRDRRTSSFNYSGFFQSET